MAILCKEGDELPSVKRLITQERIQRYAEATGDFNPIHIDPEFGASSQFGGTIAHGMLVAALVSESMTQKFARHWAESGRMKLRFRAPVKPGEQIATFGTVKHVKEVAGASEVVCTVGVRKPDGESAVTGEVVVRVQK